MEELQALHQKTSKRCSRGKTPFPIATHTSNLAQIHMIKQKKEGTEFSMNRYWLLSRSMKSHGIQNQAKSSTTVPSNFIQSMKMTEPMVFSRKTEN